MNYGYDVSYVMDLNKELRGQGLVMKGCSIYMVLRILWCDIIVLKMRAPTEN
jgi:hypothetical protein